MKTKRISWLSAGDPADSFPDVESALREPDGLLAAGGDLDNRRLLSAYRRGIFPWYDEGQPILWWSPDPRCILRPANLQVSRRLRQYARKTSFELTFNRAFSDVVVACAGERRSQQGTWITTDMMSAYRALYDVGWAHSIEVWDSNDLVGGLYGLCIGRVFFGESMFTAADNASKFAMLGLAARMLANGLELIDCQVVSQHLTTMGATTVPRAEFSALLDSLCEPTTPFVDWPDDTLAVTDVWHEWRTAALH